MLDDQDWDSVFQSLADQPARALILAQHFEYLKQTLQRGPEGVLEVIDALNLGIVRLYQHSEFNAAGFQFYLLAVAGTLSPDRDPTKILREANPTEPQCPQ